MITPIPNGRHMTCCEEGRTFAASFFVLTRTALAREQVICALADWAVHLIDVHDAHGLCLPACSACRAFGGPAQGGLDALSWSAEGRVHHLVHALDLALLENQNKG